VPALQGDRGKHAAAVSNPVFDGFGDASSTDAYEQIESAAHAPSSAVPVRRTDDGAGGGGKMTHKATPRWMVVGVGVALLLGVVAIAMGFLASGGSDSGGNTATTAPPTTAQVSATVSSADLAALQARLDGYAANMSLIQQVVQAQSSVVQEQSVNISLFQQLVQDQAVTIASLQSQLNATTTVPTRSPTDAPTQPPTSSPTRHPTEAPTDPPTSAPTAPPSAPTPGTTVPAIVTSARDLGLLLANGTWVGNLQIGNGDALLAAAAPLFEHIVEVRGYMSLQGMAATALTFPLLRSVHGYFYITVNPRLTMLSCPVLETIGGYLLVSGNSAWATMNGTFPSLRTVESQVTIASNAALATPGSSFAQLSRIGGSLQISSNAAGFCTSFAPRLCPATTRWTHASAVACCTQFCSTSPLC
jgi:hypothetical protein